MAVEQLFLKELGDPADKKLNTTQQCDTKAEKAKPILAALARE